METINKPSYSIKQIGRTVLEVRMKYNRSFEQWFLLGADAHHDNPDCREDLILKHFKQASEKNAGILHFGDWICGMQSRNDKRGAKNKVKPEHSQGDPYLNALISTESNFLSPFAPWLLLFTLGNHETGLMKHLEIDVLKAVIEKINDTNPESKVYAGGYSGYVRFVFEHTSGGHVKTVLLKYRHSGGSLGEETKGFLGVNRMARMFPDADIVLSGDNHETFSTEMLQEKLNRSGEIEIKTQYHYKLPTYKDEYKDGYAGFHVEKNRGPRPLGGYWLRFFATETGGIDFEFIRAK